MTSAYVIGVDFGTDSVRSVLVDTADGSEKAAAIFYYPRWKAGLYCNPALNQFRQHPLDYTEGLEHTIKKCVEHLPAPARKNIKGISIDTTGSTPVATDQHGTPLALLPGFEENPNAMFVLWKDHTATKEATEINNHAAQSPVNYLQYAGGIYSSEWYWAKWLHIRREDVSVRDNGYSWVEHCDWIPFLLTGGNDVHQMKRSVCAAGHKALFAADWNGLPPSSFFTSLDEVFATVSFPVYTSAYTSDQVAGTLSQEWAARLGLHTAVKVGIGAFDAHMGAVGGEIEPYYLSKVMGTSTCDMLVAPADEVGNTLVAGICGQVPGSIIPGMMGMEAGQSAFGDVYAWFRNLISWPINQFISDETERSKIHEQLIQSLSTAAAALPVSATDELAIDWLNGRRTPDANQLLKGAVTGLDLATDAPHFFRAMVESTCFGARAIVDRFIEQGIPVKGLIGLGGVARKSPFVMQMMADVMNRPIRIHRSEQTCAAGAAMFAAVVAGIFPTVEKAMHAMGQGFDTTYSPDPAKTSVYEERYLRYLSLGKMLENSNATEISVAQQDKRVSKKVSTPA